MSRKAKRIEESFARAQRYVVKQEFNPTESADSHAGVHGDFTVHWSNGITNGVEFLFGFRIAGWYYIPDDADPVGPFETSQAAFGAYVEAVDAEIRAGLALS